MPIWVRAYLLLGAAQGLTIGITGMAAPAHVVGFPLSTTPLNVRFAAAFYLAGALGLILSAMSHRAVDARIFVVGFIIVTTLLLFSTLYYWDDFTVNGTPWAWLLSYILEPLIGWFVIIHLGLTSAAEPGQHRWSPVFGVQAGVFGVVGVALLVAPTTVAHHWPWALTGVLGRVYAAIFLAYAVGALLAAGERRAAAVRPFAASSLAFLGFALLASLIHHDRLASGLPTVAWFLALGVGVVALTAVVLDESRRPAPVTA
jgi:hypothetical protein